MGEDSVALPDVQELDLDSYVPALLTWVTNKYSADSSQLYRRRFGIGIADWRVLAYLAVKKSGTGAEMSEFLGMDKAAISRSVQSLTERQCIRITAQIGRRSQLALTEEGARLHDQVYTLALKREAALLEGFDDAERTTLLRLLHKLHKNLPGVTALSAEPG